MSNASYLKLKAKIAKLEHDLNTLVQHHECFEATLIKARHGLKQGFIESINYSTRNKSLNCDNGILQQIQAKEAEKIHEQFIEKKIFSKLLQNH